MGKRNFFWTTPYATGTIQLSPSFTSNIMSTRTSTTTLKKKRKLSDCSDMSPIHIHPSPRTSKKLLATETFTTPYGSTIECVAKETCFQNAKVNCFTPAVTNMCGLSPEVKKRTIVTVTTANLEKLSTQSELARREERKARFALTKANGKGSTNTTKIQSVDPIYKPLTNSRNSPSPTFDVTDESAMDGALVGENMNIEKSYLRLTTFPKKEDVRPLSVLIKALAYIKSRYVKTEDFEYANEQLKSVRQDLTVQSIRNEFVLDVYETHARILLEHGDLNEFHQCQTMIRSLTSSYNNNTTTGSSKTTVGDLLNDDLNPSLVSTSHSKHTSSTTSSSHPHHAPPPLRQSHEAEDEFLGYGILYSLVRNSAMDLKKLVARATLTTSSSPQSSPNNNKNSNNTSNKGTSSACARHALQVVRAVNDYDFRTFFRLYVSAPHMSAYLMDFLVKRVREQAYERIIAAYRPSVNIEHVRESLRFDDLEETRLFLRQHGAVFFKETTGPPFWVDCKESFTQYLASQQKTVTTATSTDIKKSKKKRKPNKTTSNCIQNFTR